MTLQEFINDLTAYAEFFGTDTDHRMPSVSFELGSKKISLLGFTPDYTNGELLITFDEE